MSHDLDYEFIISLITDKIYSSLGLLKSVLQRQAITPPTRYLLIVYFYKKARTFSLFFSYRKYIFVITCSGF